jgi:hypothetical protein
MFDSLSVKEILKWSLKYPEVDKYWPIKRELLRYPRWYIANMVYSIVGQAFKNWVSEKTSERDDHTRDKGDHNVVILPEFKKIFDSSTHFSGMILISLYT